MPYQRQLNTAAARNHSVGEQLLATRIQGCPLNIGEHPTEDVVENRVRIDRAVAYATAPNMYRRRVPVWHHRVASKEPVALEDNGSVWGRGPPSQPIGPDAYTLLTPSYAATTTAHNYRIHFL